MKTESAKTAVNPPGPFGGRVLWVGTWLGVRVGIDPSWFIVFVLITYSLGDRFTRDHPEWPVGSAWVAGVAASLLYFLSILLHEFGHSITSKLLGLPVISITLFLFGGMAQLSAEPSRPRDAFLIAAAGPGVSVALGLFFLVVWGYSPEDGTVSTVAFNLGWINLILAAFNSIPGFPLDGGHMLRSILWRLTGSFEQATRWAGNVGMLFARLLIALGFVIAILARSPIEGLFIALVGWFLLRAARANVTQVVVKGHLRRVSVRQAMDRDFPTADGWQTLEDIAEGPLLNEGHSFVLVTEEGVPCGLIGLADVRAVPEGKRAYLRANQSMHPLADLRRVGPDQTLLEAFKALEGEGGEQLLVIHESELVGVLTRDRMTRILRNRMSIKSNDNERESAP